MKNYHSRRTSFNGNVIDNTQEAEAVEALKNCARDYRNHFKANLCYLEGSKFLFDCIESFRLWVLPIHLLISIQMLALYE